MIFPTTLRQLIQRKKKFNEVKRGRISFKIDEELLKRFGYLFVGLIILDGSVKLIGLGQIVGYGMGIGLSIYGFILVYQYQLKIRRKQTTAKA